MSTPRMDHCFASVRLNSITTYLYVIGGFDGSVVLDSVESNGLSRLGFMQSWVLQEDSAYFFSNLAYLDITGSRQLAS